MISPGIMRIVVSTLLATVTLAGCSNKSDSGNPRNTRPQSPRESAGVAVPSAKNSVPESSPAISPEEVSVEIIDEATLASVLRRNRGKVVLIDYWATWCASCLELFPHTVELHRKLADKGLITISISLDEPENEPNVREFLAKQGAAFENFISRYGGGTQSADAFGLPSGVPYFQLYDRNGKLSKAFPSPIDPDEIDETIDEAVEKLLAVP